MKPSENEPPDDALAALFDAERRRPNPAPELRARVRARVMASIVPPNPGGGSSPGPTSPPAPSPPTPPPTMGAGSLLGPILLGAALGGAVAGAILARPDPVPAPAAISVPSSTRVMTPPSSPAVADTALPPPAVPMPAPSASTGAAERDEGLAAERRILDEAQRALGASQSAAAIEALERHAREFPRGRHTEEREGLWVRALVLAGRTDEARARAARFRERFPHSILLPAVEAAIAPEER